MENSANDTKQQIMQPTIDQLGAKLKGQYNNLKGLLSIGEPPIDLADKVNDAQFKTMATRAIQERKLFLPLKNGTEQAVEFSSINKRFSLLPEDIRKKIGINNINIDSLIPKEETITKISQAINEGEKKSANFDLGVFISAIINFITGLFSDKKVSWNEAKTKAAIPHVQENINNKLYDLARQDINVREFLSQKTENGNVLDSISSAVPAGVYKHFELTAPKELRVPKTANLIASTDMGKPIKFKKEEIISKVRGAVLYPKDANGKMGDLGEEISKKIFEGSEERKKQAEAEYKSASIFSPTAYAKRELTNELTLKSQLEAKKMGAIAATAVADGITKSIEDPKFNQTKNKEQAAEFIAERVSTTLESRRKDLIITKTLDSTFTKNAISIAEMTGAEALKDLPKKVGENQYAVVTLDTIKEQILKDVRSGITDDVYKQLKQASRIVSKDKNNTLANNTTIESKLQSAAKEAAGKASFPVEDCNTCTVPSPNTIKTDNKQNQL